MAIFVWNWLGKPRGIQATTRESAECAFKRNAGIAQDQPMPGKAVFVDKMTAKAWNIMLHDFKRSGLEPSPIR